MSYRPGRLHKLAESIPWNRFLGSLNFHKFGLRRPLLGEGEGTVGPSVSEPRKLMASDLTYDHVLINNKDIMFVHCWHFGKNYFGPIFSAILLLTRQSVKKISYEYVHVNVIILKIRMNSFFTFEPKI